MLCETEQTAQPTARTAFKDKFDSYVEDYIFGQVRLAPVPHVTPTTPHTSVQPAYCGERHSAGDAGPLGTAGPRLLSHACAAARTATAAAAYFT
jgi:hypothetical protein